MFAYINLCLHVIIYVCICNISLYILSVSVQSGLFQSSVFACNLSVYMLSASVQSSLQFNHFRFVVDDTATLAVSIA